MAMTQEQFESLVQRLESDSARDPRLYRLRLTGFALLGYLYIGAVMCLLLLLVAGMLVLATRGGGWILLLKKIGLVVMGLIVIVARAMWVKFDAPTGRRIVRAQAPRIFEMIDDIRRQARAPVAHEVLITEDFNAAVVQLPRLGIFGWPKNYLLLGLPLMQALPLEEFKAVLAHEFGHLSGAHGKFGAWIYRLRQGWARLSTALSEQEHWGSFLFVPFFRWFSPAFSAYSFVQARQQEYEADRVSAEVAGANSAAAALVRVNTQGDFLSNRYWADVFRRTESDPHPLATPYAGMRAAFAQSNDPNHVASLLRSAMSTKTGYADTHPCLADRLRALEVNPKEPSPIEGNAADALLGSLASDLALEFDHEWQSSVREWWHRQHEYIRDSRQELEQFDGRAGDELSVEEEWRRARLTEEFRDAQTAFAMYEKLVEREPTHASARFALGRMLLARNDESGIQQLMDVCRTDPSATQLACDLIIGFLRGNGRDEEARKYIDRYIEAADIEEAARKERGAVRTTDKFLPHQLDPLVVQELVAQLEKYPIRRAYLVRKSVQHHPDEPLYVLGLQQRRGFLAFFTAAKLGALSSTVSSEITCPGETLIIEVDGDNKSFRGPLKKVSGSLIFERR
jgi:Zn-dependent protease with chaperone function